MSLPKGTFDPDAITRAQDILTKWQKGTTPGPWTVSQSGNWVTSDADDIARAGGDSHLIAGLSGNPGFLKWLDFLLHTGAMGFDDVDACVAVQNIAEKIIEADERMP